MTGEKSSRPRSGESPTPRLRCCRETIFAPHDEIAALRAATDAMKYGRRASAARMHGAIWIATSGCSSEGRRGSFLSGPPTEDKVVAFYATCFPTTEISGSFYRTPSLEAGPQGFSTVARSPSVVHPTQIAGPMSMRSLEPNRRSRGLQSPLA